MNFNFLSDKITSVHNELQTKAKSAVNILLTVRNWLVGYYIVEYEQNGSDKAKYGDKLLFHLSDKLNIKGLSVTNLKLNRQFYLAYPQIGQSVTDLLTKSIQAPIEIFNITPNLISQSLNDQLKLDSAKAKTTVDFSDEKIHLVSQMIQSLSFTHITQILSLEGELKQSFYIVEAIKGVWSVRELKRQINSLYFERSGLSTNKEKLSQYANQNTETENMVQTIRNPMVFEFLDLPTNETLEESHLEKALMDDLQQFLLELGFGFCFEARQKRILLDDEYYYIDLVFYHRVLKCHILIELKTEAFTHENIGQLNVYLQHYKEMEMQPTDNPPIGILLCTKSKPQMVRYALVNKENMQVSQYRLQLPDEKELNEFIKKQLNEN